MSRPLLCAFVASCALSSTSSAQVPIRTLAVNGDDNGAGTSFASVSGSVAGTGGAACVDDLDLDGLSCFDGAGTLTAVAWPGDTLDGASVLAVGDGLTGTADYVFAGDAVAFVVQVDGGLLGVGLFQDGVVSLLSRPGEAAVGGGTWYGDAGNLRGGADGEFTFTDGQRLFVVRAGVVERLVAPGDALPGGGTLQGAGAGFLADSGDVVTNGGTADYYWAGSSDPPTGASNVVRLEVDGDRSNLLGTGDDRLGGEGFVASAGVAAVATTGAIAATVTAYEPQNGQYLDLYRIDPGGAVFDLADDQAPLGTDAIWSSTLRDDGSLVFFDAYSTSIVRLDGTTTRLLEVGDAAPGGGTITGIDAFSASPDGDWAVRAETAAGRAIFMTRDGGALERVLGVGDALDVGGGDVRTVIAVAFAGHQPFGAGTAMGRDGSLAFFAAFDDDTRGAFVAGVPPLADRPNLKTTVTLLEEEPLDDARATWRVVVENTGSATAEDFRVRVDFGFDLRVPRAPGFTSECEPIVDDVTEDVLGAECAFAPLQPGQSQQMDLPTLPDVEGDATTTATATSSTLDADASDDVGELTVAFGPARHDLEVRFADWWDAVTIENLGPSGAEIVRVDGTATGATLRAPTSRSATCTIGGDGLSFQCIRTDFLEQGDTFEVELSLLALNAAAADVTVSVNGDAEDPNPDNDTATKTIDKPATGGCDCERNSAVGGDDALGPWSLVPLALLVLRRRARRP